MNTRPTTLRLLPPAALHKTGEVDHADWNYRPLLGAISRTRFRLIASMLNTQPRAERLLEIGYGSGVLMPELSRYCERLYGLDVHGEQERVAASLAAYEVTAQLFSGSVSAMPFADDYFDCLVAVSALEFVSDLDAACAEIKRVLKPGGAFLVVTPGHTPLVDFGLKLLTGKSAKEDFGGRREQLIPTLFRHFNAAQQLTVPARGRTLLHLYTALKLVA